MAVRIGNNYCGTSQSLDQDTIKANKETGIIFQCENFMGSTITVENENCYPMVAPGKSNAQMIGLPIRKQLEQAVE